MISKTEVRMCDDAGIMRAAELLKTGQLVAFPTETVYGLGALARDSDAVHRIFKAKERPADNPLITHIAAEDQIWEFAREVPEEAQRLMEAFWPGPLTLVLKVRPGALPDAVTAGLDTFTVRRPSHEVAVRLIEAAGPIAAPSANRSGKPSPTSAEHVLEDMNGIIPLILDGGSCEVGLESTVLAVLPEAITLLRPGGVTREMIERLLGRAIAVAHGVDEPLSKGAIVRSPGLKHRHYAPSARMVVADRLETMLRIYDDEIAMSGRPVLLLTSGDGGDRYTINLGEKPEASLFAALRESDAMGATLVIFQAVPEDGIGHAIMNRALRAAGFHRER